MTSASTPQIIVAGMGPVGMTAALMLAKKGLNVTVLEAGDDLATESRASTFHPPSLEILDEIGVVEELLQQGLKAPTFQYRGHKRELIANFDLEILSEDTRFPFRVQCEQSKLTGIIRNHLEKMPNVTLLFNTPVERAELGRDCVYLYQPGDGFTPSFKADWVIAADGSNSAIRRSLGIAFEGVTYPERFLVASTSHEFAEEFEDLAYVSYVYDPEDWGVLLRTPSHWRVLFPIDEGESNEAALDPQRIEERLQGVCQRDEPYPVLHSTIYAVHQRLASTFGVARVLLAGDAAHINNPLGGMGMNSGIHDAHAAVQAVLYALDGGDPDRAVETYARVRREAAAIDVQKNTQKNYEEMRERDNSQRTDRKNEMAEIAADPVRARLYLRGTSMISSFEISRRRMARGLSPLHVPIAAPAGQQLSDLIRDGVLMGTSAEEDGKIRYIGAHEIPADAEELFALTQSAGRPVIADLDVDLSDTAAVSDAVRRLERGGIAGIRIADEANHSAATVAEAIRAALAARRDMLLLVSVANADGPQQTIDRAKVFVEAGADLIGLVDMLDLDRLADFSHEVPLVPIVVILDSKHDVPDDALLTLAGVRVLLQTAKIPVSA